MKELSTKEAKGHLTAWRGECPEIITFDIHFQSWRYWTYGSRPFWSVGVFMTTDTGLRRETGFHIYNDGEVIMVSSETKEMRGCP